MEMLTIDLLFLDVVILEIDFLGQTKVQKMWPCYPSVAKFDVENVFVLLCLVR